jgi:Flp pilus assembly pilin Flp
MTRALARKSRKDRGVSSVEYIIILVLVAVTGIALFRTLGTNVRDRMNTSNTAIGTVAPVAP